MDKQNLMRSGFAAILFLSVFTCIPPLFAVDPQLKTNRIVAENALPGATDWQLTRVRVDSNKYRSPWIEGYCSRQSVKTGETVEIKVSVNPPRSFLLEIFRTGFYGGAGARLMTTVGPLKGTSQPTPAPGPKDLHECRWETTHSLTIPNDWVSGVYLGRMTTIPESALWSRGTV